nr:MAG TPA: hypothetical protein [Caudoviricetes sp.]
MQSGKHRKHKTRNKASIVKQQKLCYRRGDWQNRKHKTVIDKHR